MERSMDKMGKRGLKKAKEVGEEGVIYPRHIKDRLDKALANIVAAKTDEEKFVAMKEYSKEMVEAKSEQERRMELVEFKGKQIHRFELWAMEAIVQEINEDYAEQRIVDPDFERPDFSMDEFNPAVRDNRIEAIGYDFSCITRIPKSINLLVNLKALYLVGHKIKKIENLDNLIKLETLRLDNNEIDKIENIDGLKSLKYLYLAGNKQISTRVPAVGDQVIELERTRGIIINVDAH